MASRYLPVTTSQHRVIEYVEAMKWDVFSRTCPSRQLLDRIADKWTVLVLCALEEGPLRFGQLRRTIGGAAPKVLTSVLRALERDGALVRRVYTRSPLRVEYSLTPLGRSLQRVVDGMGPWVERNMMKVANARARFDRTMLEKNGTRGWGAIRHRRDP